MSVLAIDSFCSVCRLSGFVHVVTFSKKTLQQYRNNDSLSHIIRRLLLELSFTDGK